MPLVYQEILPLIFIIFTGIILKRFTEINSVLISTILIFIATPCIIFLGAYHLELSAGLILLPFFIFSIGIIFSLAYERLTHKWWEDGTHRLLAIAVGTSNTGYFGVPVTIAILGEQALPAAIMFAFGQILFVNTFGYYMAARHQHSISDAKKKLLTLPILYALLLGLGINYFNIELHSTINSTIVILSELYVPLGMILIGVMLASLKSFKLDAKYILSITLNKFLIWPLATIAVIFLDKNLFPLLSTEVYSVMLLQSVAPSGANMAAFSTQFNLHPDKAATGIFITTVIAIFYMPFVGSYMISFL